MRRTLTALLGTITVVPLLVGCGTDPDRTTGSPDPSTSTPVAAQPIAASPVDGVPAFPATTEPQSGEGSGAGLVLVDVRVGEQDGYDRIVLEFSGRGTPGWVASYVDRAVLDGSGEVVDLGGRSVLDVYASGTTAPAPDYYSGPERVAGPEGGAVDEVYVAGTFEGTTQVLAGIADDAKVFRTFTLTGPTRLVVDVQDAD